MVQQEPEDVDPDRCLHEGELTELPEASLRGRERIYMEPLSGQRNPEISAKPALDIQITPEDPEEIAAREGIHERIQAEIHQGNKEVEARAEEMLEVPPELNKVPDLMMEEEDVLPEDMGSNKRSRDEISRGRRKRRKEDYIRPEKWRQSPTVSRRIQNPEGFYSKDWDKDKQEEDEW